MHKPSPLRGALTSGTGVVLLIALVRTGLHFWTNAFAGYGYFRDELYYLACADHLDIGFVDHPPLSILLLAINRLLFGDSIFALRLIPALAGGATVFLAGRIAAALGGGRTAQAFAALGTCISPVLLAFCTIYSMNSLDVLFWTLAAYTSIRLVQTGDGRYWSLLGVTIGIGALNKIGILWLAAGLFIGILFSPYRKLLWTRWALRGAAIAVFCFLPYVFWNILNDFAHLEFIRNATAGKYSGLSPLRFLGDQILLHNPASVPLWLAGFTMLLFSRRLAPYRFLGIAIGVVALILIINGHSKGEYLAAAFPALFAAGGVAIEGWTTTGLRRLIRPAYALFMIAGGVALLPLAIPILPVTSYVSYADSLGVVPQTSELKRLGVLPQFYADMFGWPEKAAAVAQVYNSLSPEEKPRCAIFADNYGRTAAIDFFGKHYGLPRAIGGHNNYWLWGPGRYTGEIVIILGGALRDHQSVFDIVEVAGTVSSPWCMPYENDLPIYLCRGLHTPLAHVWGKIKHYE